MHAPRRPSVVTAGCCGMVALALVAASSARAAGVTFTAADPGAVVPSGALHTIDTVIRNTGAYTSAYSSVGFNGFPPLDVVVI